MNRSLLLVFSFLIATLCAAPTAMAQIQESISDITGVQRVVSDDLRDAVVHGYAGDDIAYKAEYTYNPTTGAAAWQLAFYGFASSPTDMSAADRVLVWIDGQRIQSTETEGRSRRMTDSVLEMQTVDFGASVFERMAHAENVEFTIGSAEFDLSHAERADMRAVIQTVQELNQQGPEQHRADNGGDER